MMKMNSPVLTSRNIGTAKATAKAQDQMYSGRRPILSVSRAQAWVAKMPIAEAMHKATSVCDLVGQVLAVQVGNHVSDGHGVAGGLGDAQADALDDVAPVGLQDLLDGRLDDVAAVLDLVEDGGFGDLGADDQSDDDQHDAGQEGNAPGEFAAELDAEEEHEVGQQQPDREAGLDHAGVLSLRFPGCVFVAHEDGAAPLRAEGQALDDADKHQQSRSQQTHLGVGGEQADDESGDAHEDQGGHQDRLAADLVPEVPADDAADRARRESDTQGGEGSQGSGHRIAGGEEGRTEVQGSRCAEADEVIGFDDGADAGADRDPFRFPGAVHRAPHGESFVAHVNPFRRELPTLPHRHCRLLTDDTPV